MATALQAQEGFGTYLRNVIQKQEKGILVTAKLIEACGLCDSLDLLMDYEYERRYQQGVIPTNIRCDDIVSSYLFYAPRHRRYGYTLFAETDDFWENVLGKSYKAVTAADVAAYIRQHCQFAKDYISNGDYSNPENDLYQFVTYHLLNRRLSADRLVNHVNELEYQRNSFKLGVPVCEYYTTMGDRRLLRVYESKESQGIYLNRFPVLDNRRQGTYHELSCDPDKAGILINWPSDYNIDYVTIGGIIYPIGQLLAFDKATAQNMGSIRLRLDVASFFPEMANNDIRLSQSAEESRANVYLPCDIYSYLDDLTVNNNNTLFCYWTGYGRGWANMQGDEFACFGLQDITLRLPPVPKSGTYELRLATQSGNANRTTIQTYFGTDGDNMSLLGMPVDERQGPIYLRTKSTNIPIYIGYESDTGDDCYDQMRDNEFYENGYMKSCKQYCAGSTTSMREDQTALRRVLGRVRMEADQTYFLRFKSVLDNPNTQLYLDFIEFCPECVYDNPNEPEDIW